MAAGIPALCEPRINCLVGRIGNLPDVWLGLAQPDSWATCNVLLLNPNVPSAGKTFAAQTFRAKVSLEERPLMCASIRD